MNIKDYPRFIQESKNQLIQYSLDVITNERCGIDKAERIAFMTDISCHVKRLNDEHSTVIEEYWYKDELLFTIKTTIDYDPPIFSLKDKLFANHDSLVATITFINNQKKSGECGMSKLNYDISQFPEEIRENVLKLIKEFSYDEDERTIYYWKGIEKLTESYYLLKYNLWVNSFSGSIYICEGWNDKHQND